MEKKEKVAIAVIGTSIAVVSGISILYWLKGRKLEELEEKERLEEEANDYDDYDAYERPNYALKENKYIQPIRHGIPPRGGFKDVPQNIPPRGGFALLRLRRDPRRVPLRVLEKHQYENEIEKRELTERIRRKSPRFTVMRTPFGKY